VTSYTDKGHFPLMQLKKKKKLTQQIRVMQ